MTPEDPKPKSPTAPQRKPAQGDEAQLVCLAVVAGAHGVQGAVRIKYFTADSALLQAYGPLYDETGTERLEITIKSTLKGVVIAEIEGIDDRDAAEALKGLRLCVERGAFPEPGENEYYHADLIGLPVHRRDGEDFGTVREVHNFGAGDVLEIAPSAGGEPILIPFTKAWFPIVDLEAGRVVVEWEESTG
ncbi:MAG: ribosome maturation factor RimM [Proteobacteria bacterium]|nr:ribosome maturation factor RimM [Pseudomonadota bacterium]